MSISTTHRFKMLLPWLLLFFKRKVLKIVLVTFFQKTTTKIIAKIATTGSAHSFPCLDLNNFFKNIMSHNLIINTNREGEFVSALCDIIKNYKYCKNDADQVQNDTEPNKSDQPIIGPIKEALRGSLTAIASKLLSSEHSKLEDLSLEEQNLWKSFDNSDIYEFITGEPDCIPEFQFD